MTLPTPDPDASGQPSAERPGSQQPGPGPQQPPYAGGFPPPYGTPGAFPPPPYFGAPGYPPPYGAPGGYPGRYADPMAKSRLAAGLLGILLGGLGAHNFYLGYTGKAMLQLLLTVLTCGLAHFWGLIEGILYLVGSGGFTTDATGRPLRD